MTFTLRIGDVVNYKGLELDGIDGIQFGPMVHVVWVHLPSLTFRIWRDDVVLRYQREDTRVTLWVDVPRRT